MAADKKMWTVHLGFATHQKNFLVKAANADAALDVVLKTHPEYVGCVAEVRVEFAPAPKQRSFPTTAGHA